MSTELIAEGRRLYAAAKDEGEDRIVLATEGAADSVTDLLVWAGNNLPALLDRIEFLEKTCADWATAYEDSKTRNRDHRHVLRGRITELESQLATPATREDRS